MESLALPVTVDGGCREWVMDRHNRWLPGTVLHTGERQGFLSIISTPAGEARSRGTLAANHGRPRHKTTSAGSCGPIITAHVSGVILVGVKKEMYLRWQWELVRILKMFFGVIKSDYSCMNYLTNIQSLSIFELFSYVNRCTCMMNEIQSTMLFQAAMKHHLV